MGYCFEAISKQRSRAWSGIRWFLSVIKFWLRDDQLYIFNSLLLRSHIRTTLESNNTWLCKRHSDMASRWINCLNYIFWVIYFFEVISEQHARAWTNNKLYASVVKIWLRDGSRCLEGKSKRCPSSKALSKANQTEVLIADSLSKVVLICLRNSLLNLLVHPCAVFIQRVSQPKLQLKEFKLTV
jgi:hypothetical protein